MENTQQTQDEYLHKYMTLVRNEQKLGDAINDEKYVKAYTRLIEEAKAELLQACLDAVNTMLIKNNENGRKQLKRREEILKGNAPALMKAFKARNSDEIMAVICKTGTEASLAWFEEYLPAERENKNG